MSGLLRVSDFHERISAYLEFMQDKEYLAISCSDSLSARFSKIKHNYGIYQKLVDAGFRSWMDACQYEIADWLPLFTPIEMAAWSDIREKNIPLWPQLPVGRFFVDFGNPVVKIALECDGKEWHDERKDAERDRILGEMGWRVFRAEGWRCKRVMPYPDDFNDWSEPAKAEFRARKHWETLDRIIEQVEHAFEVRS